MSHVIEVKVPDIGDYKNVPVIDILVKVGDAVAAEDPLVTLESDKATMDVPSPQAGIVKEIKVKIGDKLSEGAVVLALEAGIAQNAAPTVATTTASAPPAKPNAASTAAPNAAPTVASTEATKPALVMSSEYATPLKTPPPPVVPTTANPNAAHASPSIRRFARELGVDLARVTASGLKGRIVKEDIQKYVKGELAQPRGAGGVASGGSLPFNLPPLAQVDFAKFGAVEMQPLSRIKKLSGGFLHRNWVSIPHVTQHDEADITDMEAFRKERAEELKKDNVRFTPLVFLLKASVIALKKFPQFNASLSADGEALVLKQYFHIGVAVDTPNGLVVPVIRDVDKKGLVDLAKELADVSARMRDGKIKPDDLQGGCFSISSLGGIGGTFFTPIINAPEVAILGVSKAQTKPVWDGKQFAPRLLMPLSLSYDHRVIDGAQGARFLTFFGSVLNDVRQLAL